MKKASAPAPVSAQGQPAQREQRPMKVDVKINTLRTDGPVLANASVNLNGCFAIRGVKVIDSEKGPFVSMPSYKSGGEYRDICFPCTQEFHQQFHQAVLDAYQQALTQLPQRQQTAQATPAQDMGMTM